jgi:signal transduction histidine kinase
VRDDGNGIAPEDLDRIFLPFHTKKEKGLGIGLSLVQKIATAHGGRVTVESAKGAGSSFRLFLPNT